MHISLKRGCFCAAKVFIFFHVRKPFILKSFKVFLKIVKPPNFHVQSVAQFLHLEAKKKRFPGHDTGTSGNRSPFVLLSFFSKKVTGIFTGTIGTESCLYGCEKNRPAITGGPVERYTKIN